MPAAALSDNVDLNHNLNHSPDSALNCSLEEKHGILFYIMLLAFSNLEHAK